MTTKGRAVWAYLSMQEKVSIHQIIHVSQEYMKLKPATTNKKLRPANIHPNVTLSSAHRPMFHVIHLFHKCEPCTKVKIFTGFTLAKTVQSSRWQTRMVSTRKFAQTVKSISKRTIKGSLEYEIQGKKFY